MKRFTSLTSTLVLASVSHWSVAQETGDGATASDLDTITVIGTRTERSIGETAATVSVRTNDDIERELARDIADLVRFEPGVTVAGTGSRFGLSGFSIRGVGGNRVLTLVDGIRVAEEFSFGPFLSARRDFIDVDSLSRAEIARGPISSLYGSDALGGVVAFTTKRPRDYLSADDSFHAGFKGGISGADESTVAGLTLATGGDLFSGMIFYNRRDGHETENQGSVGGTGPTRELPDPQEIGSDNIVAKVGFHPGENHDFTLTYDFLDNETETRILSDYETVVFGTTVNTRDALDERTRERWSLAYEYVGDLLIADQLMATAYTQTSETSQLTSETRTTPAFESQTRFRRSAFDQEIDGAFLQLSKSIEMGSTTHLITYGADYYKTDNAGIRDGGTFDATGAPVFEFFPFPTRDFPLTAVRQTAFFLQDEIGLMNDRLLISPGIRYDDFDAKATADDVYISGNPGTPLPEDYDDSEVTAKIGVLYQVSDSISAYVRYSEGFRAPPYDDVNVGFSNFIGGYKTIANPDLKSERSDGYELGARFQGRAGSVSIAAFRNDYEDFIESSAIAPEFLPSGIDPADGLLTFQSINREEVEISGLELTGVFDLGLLSGTLDGMSLRTAIAYADSEDKSDGAPINSVEPLTGVVGLGYSPADRNWGGELIMTAVDGKSESDINPDDPRTPTSGYGIIDLVAYYDFSDRVSVNVGLFNITDRTYVRWADSGGIGGDAPLRFSQPGFNAAATIRVEL